MGQFDIPEVLEVARPDPPPPATRSLPAPPAA